MVKLVENGYILAVSATATDGVEITEQEYNAILTALHNRLQSKDGFALMLKDSTLEWEYVAIEPEPLTDEETLTRCANTLTGADVPDPVSAEETTITVRIKED